MLEQWFDLKARRTTVSAEIRGAVATFLTMAYILVANPAILSAAGVPFSAALAGTALSAGLSCILMGLYANFPLALASGMGLNSVIAFQITPALGSWQAAMALVFIDGIFVLFLVLAGFREAVMRAIPRDLKLAVGAGIGLFIVFIGLLNAKLVVVPPGTISVLSQNPSAIMPPVSFGSLSNPEAYLTLVGLSVIAILMARRIKGAVLYGIGVSAILGTLAGLTPAAPLTSAWPDFSAAFALDFLGVLKLSAVPLLLSLVMVDFFDTLGTVTAISEQAAIITADGRVPRLRRILGVDAIAASLGGLLGASSVTSYIESASGVAEGARTGLHSVVVGLFFLIALFAAPLIALIPSAATSPALIIVGFLMASQIKWIEFDDMEKGIPAFLTLATIPFTFSIAHGIGMGMLSHVAIKIGRGKSNEVPALMYVSAAIFALYFALAH